MAVCAAIAMATWLIEYDVVMQTLPIRLIPG